MFHHVSAVIQVSSTISTRIPQHNCQKIQRKNPARGVAGLSDGRGQGEVQHRILSNRHSAKRSYGLLGHGPKVGFCHRPRVYCGKYGIGPRLRGWVSFLNRSQRDGRTWEISEF
jgi:hypothetical protein